jgi:hypothetical protein
LFGVRSLLVQSLYQIGRGEAADALLQAFLIERPSDLTYLSTLGLIAAQRGDTVAADSVSALLASRDLPPYGRRNFTSARGRIAAMLGRRADAVRLLQQARDEGWPILNLHLSTEVQLLRGDSAFEALIGPRSE